MTRAVSSQIINVLSLAKKGVSDLWRPPLVDGKGSQSRTVGRMLSIEAAQRHGWLDREGKLTENGETVLAEQESRAAAQERFFQRQGRLASTRWEKGYRSHGLWRGDTRLGCISLGPPQLWDGTYAWSVDNHGPAGETQKLADAKRAVEDAVAFPLEAHA